MWGVVSMRFGQALCGDAQWWFWFDFVFGGWGVDEQVGLIVGVVAERWLVAGKMDGLISKLGLIG